MIINKETKSILTRSDKPNENWTSQDCYVVDDNNVELCQKILNNYPNIEYIIENDVIVDVKILEAPKEETEKEITPEERLAALEAAVLEMALGGAE